MRASDGDGNPFKRLEMSPVALPVKLLRPGSKELIKLLPPVTGAAIGATAGGVMYGVEAGAGVVGCVP